MVCSCCIIYKYRTYYSYCYCSGHLGSPAGKSSVVAKLPTLEWTPSCWFSCWRMDRGSTNRPTQHVQMKCEPVTPHARLKRVCMQRYIELVDNSDEKYNYTPFGSLGKVLGCYKLHRMYCVQLMSCMHSSMYSMHTSLCLVAQ